MKTPETQFDRNLWEALPPRQRQVVIAIAQGYANGQIAKSLEIAIKTVDTHRSRLLKGLNLKNNAQLTRHMIAWGLMDPNGKDLSAPTEEPGSA